MLIRPMVVLSPTTPHHAAGSRTEPPVSVPIAQGARPAATATPDPALDPPGVRCTARSHGFQGVPNCWLVPSPPWRIGRCGSSPARSCPPQPSSPPGSRYRASGGRARPDSPRGHAARDLDEILHRHRDAVERADAMARRHGGRRGVRRGPGLVCVDIDVRVELCIITGDAVQVALDDVYRGDHPSSYGHAAGAPARMRVASAPPWAVSFSQVCERAAAIQPGSLSLTLMQH